MHRYLEDNFDTFGLFRENERRLGHLQSDAESALQDSATLVTTSGVMAAAMLADKWRIVRDDLPLETPLDLEGERRYRLFAIALGRYLACMALEERKQLARTEDGWELTDHPNNKGMTLVKLIDLEHFGNDAFTCDRDSEP